MKLTDKQFDDIVTLIHENTFIANRCSCNHCDNYDVWPELEENSRDMVKMLVEKQLDDFDEFENESDEE